MNIHVHHLLRYQYDRPVFLEPTIVRLTPRHDVTQHVQHHAMQFMPQPQGAAWTIEPDGTNARIVWFEDKHDLLTITCESTVHTLRDNPFDLLITHDPFLSLPASYPPDVSDALMPLLSTSPDAAVSAWSAELADDVDRQTLPFLMKLTETIHGSFDIIERLDGDPFSPQQTLSDRRGACRDVAMLFIAACSAQQIAARFVSGYSLHHPPETTQHELHAWAEVYVPGGGWRGYDPSLGLAVADGHVALATGPDHRLAAPLAGSYRGTGAQSNLHYDIQIRKLDDDDQTTRT